MQQSAGISGRQVVFFQKTNHRRLSNFDSKLKVGKIFHTSSTCILTRVLFNVWDRVQIWNIYLNSGNFDIRRSHRSSWPTYPFKVLTKSYDSLHFHGRSLIRFGLKRQTVKPENATPRDSERLQSWADSEKKLKTMPF